MRLDPVYVIVVIAVILIAFAARAASTVPFDEETLDRIGELNEAIAGHYEQLQTTTVNLDLRREAASTRIKGLEAELEALEDRRGEIRRLPQARRDMALQALEESRIEAKSRYLEALAEKHALDLETVQAFDTHASAILTNLERLADALEGSGRLDANSDRVARQAFHSLQHGTAIALAALEEWGTLTREDPRFRALWATARVLNRTMHRLNAPEGIRMTVDLVRERTFVVRSLIDQARAMEAALDHQGLLIQVAAQNQMLRLHFTRLGAIRGLELPDLDLEDSTRRILEDIEETPFETAGNNAANGLAGFDDCVAYGICN